MLDGKIDLDSEIGKAIGFTSDKFDLGSYLWAKEGYVYVSFIHSKDEGKGNLSALFNNILTQKRGIKVPTPFAKMKFICLTHGFKETKEWFDEVGEYAEVLVKDKFGSEKPDARCEIISSGSEQPKKKGMK